MTRLLKEINRAAIGERCDRLKQLAGTDYVISQKHLTAANHRIVHGRESFGQLVSG